MNPVFAGSLVRDPVPSTSVPCDVNMTDAPPPSKRTREIEIVAGGMISSASANEISSSSSQELKIRKISADDSPAARAMQILLQNTIGNGVSLRDVFTSPETVSLDAIKRHTRDKEQIKKYREQYSEIPKNITSFKNISQGDIPFIITVAFVNKDFDLIQSLKEDERFEAQFPKEFSDILNQAIRLGDTEVVQYLMSDQKLLIKVSDLNKVLGVALVHASQYDRSEIAKILIASTHFDSISPEDFEMALKEFFLEDDYNLYQTLSVLMKCERAKNISPDLFTEILKQAMDNNSSNAQQILLDHENAEHLSEKHLEDILQSVNPVKDCPTENKKDLVDIFQKILDLKKFGSISQTAFEEMFLAFVDSPMYFDDGEGIDVLFSHTSSIENMSVTTCKPFIDKMSVEKIKRALISNIQHKKSISGLNFLLCCEQFKKLSSKDLTEVLRTFIESEDYDPRLENRISALLNSDRSKEIKKGLETVIEEADTEKYWNAMSDLLSIEVVMSNISEKTKQYVSGVKAKRNENVR